MHSAKEQIICRTYVLSDLLALLLAFLVGAAFAGKIETGISLSDTLAQPYSIGNMAGFFALVCLWLLAYQRMGLYRPRKPAHYRPGKTPGDLVAEAAAIGMASALGTVIFAAASALFQITLLTPLFFSIFLPCVTFVDLLLRRAVQYSLRNLTLGDRNERNILIIGSNVAAYNYANMISGNQHLGYKLLGFMDNRIVAKRSENLPHLGALRDFPALLQRMVVDEVVIAMPTHASRDEINKIISRAHGMGISVRFPAAQLFSHINRHKGYRIAAEFMPGPARAPNLDVVIYSGHQIGWPYLTKRVLDLSASAVLVVLTTPIMLAAALLIVLSSGRPVLYIQERYGYNSRIFHLYKFRTMVKDAENLQEILRARSERDGAAFKMRKDPRVTRVGKWLRKASIDELPQLFNVLRGEMSLVGPRPLPLPDYARMDDISQRRRLSVLPGLTGPWQISGRDNVSFEEWMRMDLEYIDSWRLETDLKILLKTIPVVLSGRGSH